MWHKVQSLHHLSIPYFNMIIIGISAFYHDSAACLIRDGEVIAAAQEERFSRKRHDESFPVNAINYCIKEAGIQSSDINYIVFYDKPFLKFERLLETYLAFAPKGFMTFLKSFPIWVKDKLFQKKKIISILSDEIDNQIDWSKKLLFSEHHLSHAASAFFPSPYEEAAVLTMDGVGEWTTTSLSIGRKNQISVIKEINFPHSIGLLYSAFTYYTGFKVNSGEYKVMGLAPYGTPKYANLIKAHLVDIKDDGSFFLDMSYFDYCSGLKMTNEKFHKLFGGAPRKPESTLTQREMDLAASIQQVTEEIVIKLARAIAKETGLVNLCLAGGVALNCVANGALHREKIFKNIWIQPAAGDAGGALGAALAVHYLMLKGNRSVENDSDSMKGAYLGPEYSQAEVEKSLTNLGAVFTTYTEDEMIDRAANALAQGNAVGWHQGRMEFGPRSLGCRSIIADPRSQTMQKILNLKIKQRESFRPFAPSILYEDVNNWFDLNIKSPYMLIVADVVGSKQLKLPANYEELFGIERLNYPKSEIPAVTHVDNSARIQTVHFETNPTYYKLLKKFKEITGCPILVNTSFNVRGEPIVCAPEDSFRCFMGTGLDFLFIGLSECNKVNQLQSNKVDYVGLYELD